MSFTKRSKTTKNDQNHYHYHHYHYYRHRHQNRRRRRHHHYLDHGLLSKLITNAKVILKNESYYKRV